MYREDKITGALKELAAKFLAYESNRTSLITITNAALSSDGKRATIFFTVLPEDKEQEALQFLARQGYNFKEFIKEELEIRMIPHIEFKIDVGEKNRQNIDTIINKI